jgi:hypothetical protein
VSLPANTEVLRGRSVIRTLLINKPSNSAPYDPYHHAFSDLVPSRSSSGCVFRIPSILSIVVVEDAVDDDDHNV